MEAGNISDRPIASDAPKEEDKCMHDFNQFNLRSPAKNTDDDHDGDSVYSQNYDVAILYCASIEKSVTNGISSIISSSCNDSIVNIVCVDKVQMERWTRTHRHKLNDTHRSTHAHARTHARAHADTHSHICDASD